jgi:two-component system, OmpR family, response regulator MprA
MAKILIADDDINLLKMLRRTLVYEGFDVVTAQNGEEALDKIHTEQPDLAVLDWMMPKMDGISVVETLREVDSGIPIMMLTARDAVEFRVQGLESGADDYLVKPFAPAELVARINTLLRRANPKSIEKELTFSYLRIIPATREAFVDDQRISLTPTEFELLHLFMLHPKQILERSQILQRIWGYEAFGEENVMEVYIGYLRRKTELDGRKRLIQTVRGLGYVLRED